MIHDAECECDACENPLPRAIAERDDLRAKLAAAEADRDGLRAADWHQAWAKAVEREDAALARVAALEGALREALEFMHFNLKEVKWDDGKEPSNV